MMSNALNFPYSTDSIIVTSFFNSNSYGVPYKNIYNRHLYMYIETFAHKFVTVTQMIHLFEHEFNFNRIVWLWT